MELANGVTISGETLNMVSNSVGDIRGRLQANASDTATYNGPIVLSGDHANMFFGDGNLTIGGTITGPATGSLQIRGSGDGHVVVDGRHQRRWN